MVEFHLEFHFEMWNSTSESRNVEFHFGMWNSTWESRNSLRDVKFHLEIWNSNSGWGIPPGKVEFQLEM